MMRFSETSGDPSPGLTDEGWRSLPQASLDAMYDQGAYAANMIEVLDSYRVRSLETRDLLGQPIRHAYGTSVVERLDWFPGAKGGPVNLFVHGGAWRSGNAAQYHFPAATFVPAGAHFVSLDFISVLETGGNLLPMRRQVTEAIAWVARNAARLNADPGRIHVSSHSSGSHLAACASLTDWRGRYGLPEDVVKGFLYCGGVYELAPVFASSRRRYLRASNTDIGELSPLRNLHRRCVPAVVAHGANETPEFIRQSRAFASALRANGGDVTVVEGSAVNHFEILNTLGSADGLLGRAALVQMGLSGPLR